MTDTSETKPTTGPFAMPQYLIAPVTVIVAALTVTATGTWAVATKLGSIDNRITSIETALSDRWTFADQMLWAAQVERLNPGYKAPDPDSIRRTRMGK